MHFAVRRIGNDVGRFYFIGNNPIDWTVAIERRITSGSWHLFGFARLWLSSADPHLPAVRMCTSLVATSLSMWSNRFRWICAGSTSGWGSVGGHWWCCGKRLWIEIWQTQMAKYIYIFHIASVQFLKNVNLNTIIFFFNRRGQKIHRGNLLRCDRPGLGLTAFDCIW